MASLNEISRRARTLDQWLCLTADRARINASRTRDNLDVAQASPVEAGEDLSGLVSDDSESRLKIEAMIGIGNKRYSRLLAKILA
jgi:hypothetical protein